MSANDPNARSAGMPLPLTASLSSPRRFFQGDLGRALLLSQGIALIWWLVALWARGGGLPIPVWYDQQRTFSPALSHLADPYAIPGFVCVPWTAPLLAPFSLLPLPLAMLAQLCVYFAALTGIVFKFGGGVRSVLLALTSFIAFDSALELNIDWLVCLGLLVPPVWSGPLLLVKPQDAMGYWLSLDGRDLRRAVLVTLAALLISLALWGFWPESMAAAIRTWTLGRAYNLAPSALLPWPLAWGTGAALGVLARRRRDPVLGVLAWLFFVPYITLYSLLLPFTLAAARWPRAAAVISAAMWLIYGGVLVWYVLR